MLKTSRARWTIGLLLLVSASTGICHADDARVLFDFGGPQSRGSWRNVNDGVMGGVSEGRHGITESGDLRFFGRLSLANNGGFASVRSRAGQFKLKADDELWL